MLDSMIYNPSPTRAEASDVATAIYDGVDAVMLSAETASGEYPVEAVSMMDRIIAQTERDPVYRQMVDNSRPQPLSTVSDSITASARQIAHIIAIPVIVTFSDTGSTTLRAARERPESPILALTANLQTARFLGLVWGAHAVLIPPITSFSDMVETACHLACKQNFTKKGEHILITAGVPFGMAGGTNILRIAKVD
jgi:pyruvate kinase